MSFLKNLGSKAKEAANVVGSKSQDMVEIGKYKMNISTLESDIKKLKLEIGELAYDAHSKSQEFPMELTEKINSDIDEKIKEINDLKIKIDSIHKREESAPITDVVDEVVEKAKETVETVTIKEE